MFLLPKSKFTINNIVPAPESVTVKSAPVTPICPIEPNITLTCTVELSPLVDVPVTVNTMWTGPNEVVASSAVQLVMQGSSTTYTSSALIRSFGREKSGNYTCIVTVSLMSPFINSSHSRSNISIGKIVDPAI